MRALKWLGRQLAVIPPVIVALAVYPATRWAGVDPAAAVAAALVAFGIVGPVWISVYAALRTRRPHPMPTPTPEA
ncbi:hypothetical protein [Streptomyces sp. NPDC000888]